MLTFAMVITAFSGVILLLNRKTGDEIVAAETTIDSPMAVRKMWAKEENNSYTLQTDADNVVTLDDKDNSKTNKVVSQSSLNQEIKNNELVILQKGENQKEIILVSFNLAKLTYSDSKLVATANGNSDGGVTYYTLQVNAYLNNKALKTNEEIKDQTTEDSKYYFQLLNLNADASEDERLYYSDGTAVPETEIEGKYKFVFTFSEKNVEGVVEAQQTSTMEFYVFNEATYNNGNTETKEPKLFNTEKINRDDMSESQAGGVEYNYFNFNNENTTNYWGNNEKSSTLLFPTIKYDITKYSLRYKISLYGTYNDYEYVFAGYDANGNPIVDVYKDGVKLSSTSTTENKVTTISVEDQSLNDFTIENNIISIKLSNIGEYDLEFNYVYELKEYNNATKGYDSKGYIINSSESTGYTDTNISFVKKENWANVGDCKLYIFGYQLYYSDYSNSSVSGNLEFTNQTDQFTDVTFLNDKTNDKTEKYTFDKIFDKAKTLLVNYTGNDDADISDYICATNQAPVTLSYYAKMTTDTSSRKTNSYYKYWSSVASYKNNENPTQTDVNITNNTRFTKNGYYQVFIEYQFENYKCYEDATTGTLKSNPENIKKYQFFSFAINNSEPTIDVTEIIDGGNGKTISTDGYTKENVKIKWSANTIFDIKPRVSIYKKAYKETTYTEIFNQEGGKSGEEYGIRSVNEETINIEHSNTIDTNGNYQVVIHYGPGTHTLVKYRFTIDYNDISGITAYSISDINGDNVINRSVIRNKNIINTAFALDWDYKASGAEIDVKYDFIALESGDIDNSKILDNLKTDGLTVEGIKNKILEQYSNTSLNLSNGYKLSSISNNIPYTKPTFTEIKDGAGTITIKLDNTNAMRTSAGFYLFTLTDSAGNVSYKSMFVDNSKPVIYTFTNEQSDFVLNDNTTRVIASRDTIAIWGDNKSIAIDSNASTLLETFLGISKESYAIKNGSLLVSINDRTSEGKIGDVSQQYEPQTIKAQYQIFEIKAPSENAQWYQGEHIHTVSIADQGTIVSNSGNKRNNNTATLELEMNSDNSLLMAYLYDKEETKESYERLDNASVGNGKVLYLEWIQNTGNDFEVKDITYYYFPLTFEEDSPIYPYSSTPEITQAIDLQTDTKTSENKNKSAGINIESETTLEGLYVVKREYKNDLKQDDENNISGDYSPRYYVFFIDRNKVISYAPNGTLIGGSIGLNIGSNRIANYQVDYTGADFLIDTNENNTKFITSKLPISFINAIGSLDKFDAQNNANVKDNLANTFKIAGNDTKLLLSKQIVSTFTLYDAEIFYKENASDAFPTQETQNQNARAFKLNGYYKIVLHDKTSKLETETNTLTTSDNDFTFIFQVKVDVPSASIVQYTNNSATGKDEFLYYAEDEENISTNKTNMLVVWSKPASDKGFDAEIDRQNFSIVGTLESGKEFTLTVENGVLKSNGITLNKNSKIEIQTINETSNFDNPTWDYYLDFKDIFDVLPSACKTTSAKYEIKLHYIGNESDYSETFFNTTRTIVFDFKKPEYNYNRLISSDVYLANYYDEQNYDAFVTSFNDYASEINFENYAFTVTPSFTLDEMVVSDDNIWSSSNMDTYRMFIRQYNKYEDESIENQQSIMPDDARYSDITSYPNRFRFNENYTVDGKKIYTEISSYYWSNSHSEYTLEYLLDNSNIDAKYNTYYEIIEIDYAGNYRVYTIYLKDYDDDTDGELSAEFVTRDELGENEATTTKPFTYQPSYTIGQNNNVELINGKNNLNSILQSNNWNKIFSCQLELTNLSGFDTHAQYILVTISDITKNTTTTLTLKPKDSLLDFISQINALISDYNYDLGNIYYLTFTTSQGEYLKIEHRKPSEDYPSYSISSGPIGFDIEFEVSINNINLSSYFTEFKVYKATNGVLDDTELTNDSNGNSIVSEIEKTLLDNNQDSAKYKYSFKMQGNSGSEYLIVFTDNFGRQLKIRQVIGVEDNQDKVIYSAYDYELVSTSAYDYEESATRPIELVYTNNVTTLKYQSILNTLSIYKMSAKTVNGKKVLTISDENNNNLFDDGLATKSVNGIWTYPLITSETENDTIYKVIFTSTTGNEIYYIGYNNTISDVSIVKVSDGLKTEVENQKVYTFDKMVRLQIDDTNPLFPTTVTGIFEYIDENGTTITEQLGKINNDKTFNKLGKYTFTAKNNLGTTVVFIVTIEERISGYFWVTYKIDGIEAGQLSPAQQDKTKSDTYGSLNNPYAYYTIYDYEVKTNEASQYKCVVTGTAEPISVNSQTVGTTTIYKVYKQAVDELGLLEEKDVKYISVSKLTPDTNFVRTYDNIFYINNQIQTGSSTRMSQDPDGDTKSAKIKLEKTFNLVEGNDIILGYSYNGNFIKEINLAKVTSDDEITFYDSGEYEFYFRDLAGNKQKFGNLDYFKMILINDVIFTVNTKQAVDNSVFNGSVSITLQNIDEFKDRKITLKALLNGSEIVVSRNRYTYVFEDYGVYNLTFEGQVVNEKNETTNIVTTFNFRIININEAMATYEYNGLNNYEITKIVKYDTKDSEPQDITDLIKQELNIKHISTLALSTYENGLGGAGIYEITVKATYYTSKLDQEFTFKVWLNNDTDILIKCSIDLGSSTTRAITITLNKNQIYNKVGECKIMLNNNTLVEINESTATENKAETFTINQNGVFNVRLVTDSGNTLESFIITKKEPLNAVAIVVIVISVVAVSAIAFIFIKLRKNMKVK